MASKTEEYRRVLRQRDRVIQPEMGHRVLMLLMRILVGAAILSAWLVAWLLGGLWALYAGVDLLAASQPEAAEMLRGVLEQVAPLSDSAKRWAALAGLLALLGLAWEIGNALLPGSTRVVVVERLIERGPRQSTRKAPDTS